MSRSGLKCQNDWSDPRARTHAYLYCVWSRGCDENVNTSAKNTAGFHDVDSDRENDLMRILNLPAAGSRLLTLFGEMGSRRSMVIPLTLIKEAVSSTSLFYHGDGSKQILQTTGSFANVGLDPTAGLEQVTFIDYRFLLQSYWDYSTWASVRVLVLLWETSLLSLAWMRDALRPSDMLQKKGRWLRLKCGWQWKLDSLSFLLLIVLPLWFGSWSVLDPFASLQLFLLPPLLFFFFFWLPWCDKFSQLCCELLETMTGTFCCGKCP